MAYFKEKEILTIAQEGTLSNRHISLRPTKLAVSLFVLSAAIWLGAVNYQVNVAYAVCFWVVGFIGVAALLTRRQLLGLQIELAFTDEVFAGQTADVLIRLHGGAAHRARLLWWRGEYAQTIDEHQENQFTAWQSLHISGSLNAPTETIWAIPIVQRGYFPRPLLLKWATSAPFGLFHAEARAEWQSSAVAFAAPLPHNDFGTAAEPDAEQTPQQAGAHGDDIAYLKNHQHGASLQHIAWKVYAKRGELMDKVFDEPPPAAHSEIISYRDYPQGTPVEKLASLLTYRVLQADKLGAPYTLELPNLTLTPQNGLREKCLNALALM
ncbi:DUF58 domain-containing protein [Alysiella crassa]|uniref:Uncharacterized conserved protein (Some members contain a von Willebrand factor type A (VWA) domain) n=1 Tax=Alysiella crassa TaxID=153491 RepID=A0A376BV33_9NEIS|nr:DUF58 domain-containing protein [Alysiella crassa]UOP06311.1 DUF58 domain-containing protein [Alysiella crassa]SSY80816.1 Uncharacterized conserved protein (some members contain a von Willebrand factor type A (vWA) domain) [Alysiella crassa]